MSQPDPSTTATAPDYPARVVVTFANYCGDQRSIIDQGPKGPTTVGEPMYPVLAEYDADNDTTRVGFSYLTPPA